MYLVAIGWMFVVLLMSIAEAVSPIGTVLGAFFTLLLYGLLPLSIVLYVMGTPMRRRARLAAEAADPPAQLPSEPAKADEQNGEQGSEQSAARHRSSIQPDSSLQPDRSSHAAGHTIAAERKEP